MSFRDYTDAEYARVRRAVLKRDRHRCQMPDCKNTKKLQVHHILKWASNPYLRYEMENCIVLCKECHKKVTGFEDCYISLFTRIVNENTKR